VSGEDGTWIVPDADGPSAPVATAQAPTRP